MLLIALRSPTNLLWLICHSDNLSSTMHLNYIRNMPQDIIEKFYNVKNQEGRHIWATTQKKSPLCKRTKRISYLKTYCLGILSRTVPLSRCVAPRFVVLTFSTRKHETKTETKSSEFLSTAGNFHRGLFTSSHNNNNNRPRSSAQVSHLRQRQVRDVSSFVLFSLSN